LLLREFSQTKLDQLNQNELVMFEEILNYDDQKLYDFIFKKTSLDNNLHENFINKFLKIFYFKAIFKFIIGISYF